MAGLDVRQERQVRQVLRLAALPAEAIAGRTGLALGTVERVLAEAASILAAALSAAAPSPDLRALTWPVDPRAPERPAIRAPSVRLDPPAPEPYDRTLRAAPIDPKSKQPSRMVNGSTFARMTPEVQALYRKGGRMAPGTYVYIGPQAMAALDHPGYGLTRRMADCLRQIEAGVDRDGFPPSYQELAGRLGVASRSDAFRLVAALEARGYVRRLPHRPRSIELLRRLPRRGPAADPRAVDPRVHVEPRYVLSADLAERLGQ